MSIIKAEKLTKAYGSNKVLHGLDIEISPGDSFALLGPNGAGKTTFMKSVLGLVSIDGGSLTLFDKRPCDPKSREHIAYLPEKFTFYTYFTVEDVLKFYGKMKGLNGQDLTDCTEQVIKEVGLHEQRKQKASSLSKGQLQRVGIGTLLMGDAELFLLDEPFSGLDPIGIKDLKEILAKLKRKGKTLFINSHILSEMEQICDHVGILNLGNCLYQGRVDEITQNQSLEDYFYSIIKNDGEKN